VFNVEKEGFEGKVVFFERGLEREKRASQEKEHKNFSNFAQHPRNWVTHNSEAHKARKSPIARAVPDSFPGRRFSESEKRV
jgi:hypothetical protein